MSEAIFERVGDRFLPTELARGPWDPNALHGGPIAALAARELQAAMGDRLIARLTCEFLRPAPVAPMAVEAAISQEGRSVTWITATASADGHPVARVSAVALRRRPDDLPARKEHSTRQGERSTPPGPEHGAPSTDPNDGAYAAFHNRGMEVRYIEGSLTEQGPAVAWFRLAFPLLADERPSPLVRAAAGADFSNGSSTILSWDDFTFINPDLTLYLHREPIGEWICLDSVTKPGTDATAVAESHLYDQEGPIGVTLQAVLLDRRPE